MSASDKKDRFQMLCLDGGGIRGLFSAAILSALEDDLNIRISDHFDLIAGTSTGGIIAMGLGLGLRPREIVEFYVSNGPQIFPPMSDKRAFLSRIFRPGYSQDSLSAALKKCFGDRAFGSSNKRLVIPSYSLTADDVYIFRTAHHERLRRDYKVPAWKVALATSSAPTYFPACKDVDSNRLVDGGVWANNPTMVAIVEAVGTLGIETSQISVLSIGTFDETRGRPSFLDRGGILSWVRENDAVDVILRGQSIGANNQASFLLGSERLMRIDPRVPAREFTLDKTSKSEDLIGRAAHHSRHFCPDFKAKFQSHVAPEFVPVHRL